MTEQQATKRRWYGHPFTIGAFLLLLTLDLLSIPAVHWKVSSVQRAIIGRWNTRIAAHGHSVFGEPVRTESGIQWRWPTDPDYNAPFEEMTSDDGGRVGVYVDMVRYAGFYHLTRRTEAFDVFPQDLSAQEKQAVLDAIVVAMERDPDWERAHSLVGDMIRSGVQTRSFSIYSGYVRNAMAAIVWLALIVCSTRGRPWEWFREPKLGIVNPYTRAHRRRMRNQCASCGYDLAGLESSVCPECGSEREESHEKAQ